MGLRKVFDKLFPETSKRRMFIRVLARAVKSINPTNIKKLIKIIRLYGIRHAFDQATFLLTKSYNTSDKPEYKVWMDLNEPKKEDLEKQKKYKFKIEPKISIVVPMYNTPANFFEELVDSLINQTYPNWELCLADRKSRKK